MKLNKFNISTAFIAGSLFLGLTSCNDWLSVQPQQQIEDKELFTTETGFKEALAGVYSSMLSSSTYGMELTFGTMAIIGKEWDKFPGSYEDFIEYDYEKTYPEAMIGSIWSAGYNTIANANNILKRIDESKGLFSGDNYEIIKGETLGIRAFMHFDLLRCFGVSYAVNPDMPSIPYVTEFTYKVFPQLKVNEIVTKIMDDLAEAETLLQSDPILTGREITELDDAGYLINRTVHFNYYAVKALQARVSMWCGKYEEAYKAAKTVYDSNKFSWANEAYMASGTDRAFADEQVFALNNVNLETLSDTYFIADGASSYSLSQDRRFNIYDGQSTDLRYLYTFVNGNTSTSIDKMYSTKYMPSKGTDAWYNNKMPLIRLSEMLLIMAEVNNRKDGTGLDEINTLREARGVKALDDFNEPFFDYLVKEYRREFIGEGQLFFLFKRLNLTYIPETSIDAVAGKYYTFPLPKSETESAERKENK